MKNNKKMIVILSSALFACATFAELGSIERVKPGYAFSFFRDNGQAGVFLAWSEDALNWREVNGGKPILAPQVGGKLTRDPSICRGPDGIYHMVWSTSWRDKGFGVAHSTNLLEWSEQKYVAVNKDEPGAKNTWAPEIFYDDGFNVIDAFIFKKDGRYGMIVKDETKNPKPEKNLRVVWSDGGVEGAWGKAGPAFIDNTAYWAEGPSVIQTGDRWLVYYDKYNKGGYGAVETLDFKMFTPVSVSLPRGIRHGTIVAVDPATFHKLRSM